MHPHDQREGSCSKYVDKQPLGKDLAGRAKEHHVDHPKDATKSHSEVDKIFSVVELVKLHLSQVRLTFT